MVSFLVTWKEDKLILVGDTVNGYAGRYGREILRQVEDTQIL